MLTVSHLSEEEFEQIKENAQQAARELYEYGFYHGANGVFCVRSDGTLGEWYSNSCYGLPAGVIAPQATAMRKRPDLYIRSTAMRIAHIAMYDARGICGNCKGKGTYWEHDGSNRHYEIECCGLASPDDSC